MAHSTVIKAFDAISDLKLWYNNKSGGQLHLIHVPEIIKLRWEYFRDNWEFIKSTLIVKIDDYNQPDILRLHINKLGKFIEIERNKYNKVVNPFDNANIISKYYTVWDTIPIASLQVSRQEQKLIDTRINEISNYIKTDFINIRNKLVDARDYIADFVDLDDATYNSTYDRKSYVNLVAPEVQHILRAQYFSQAIIATDYILANLYSLQTTSIDPFALAKQNADNPDIDIRLNKSGRLVRMYAGDTLQDLASRYYSDPDRWIDIAIANGLKPPYVDEEGETIPIIANGDSNKLTIAKLDNNTNKNIDKLYNNKVVFLRSNTILFPEQRLIKDIKVIPISGEIVLELSGTTDLDRMRTVDKAYIRVFKNNTVNSNFFVLIPSTDPLDNLPNSEVPFFLSAKAEDEKLAGVDLLVDDKNDLVLTSYGDVQLNYGLGNAIQSMKIKMQTEQGQNIRHLTFGLPVVVGKKGDDPEDTRNLLIQSINDMVAADQRFDRIEELDVVAKSNYVQIYLIVRMAGKGTRVPITFSLNTG